MSNEAEVEVVRSALLASANSVRRLPDGAMWVAIGDPEGAARSAIAALERHREKMAQKEAELMRGFGEPEPQGAGDKLRRLIQRTPRRKD